MKGTDISRATLGRVPVYLDYLRRLPPETPHISATAIARALGLGEVQVRKDLGALCGAGKPRTGYPTAHLIRSLAGLLSSTGGETVIIGAGKLGRALLDYGGFSDYGLSLVAAFDRAVASPQASPCGKPILPMADLPDFCARRPVRLGIIAVPAGEAQSTGELLYQNGIRAIWSFAPKQLSLPPDAAVQYENMALSLAHLKLQSTPSIS